MKKSNNSNDNFMMTKKIGVIKKVTLKTALAKPVSKKIQIKMRTKK